MSKIQQGLIFHTAEFSQVLRRPSGLHHVFVFLSERRIAQCNIRDAFVVRLLLQLLRGTILWGMLSLLTRHSFLSYKRTVAILHDKPSSGTVVLASMTCNVMWCVFQTLTLWKKGVYAMLPSPKANCLVVTFSAWERRALGSYRNNLITFAYSNASVLDQRPYVTVILNSLSKVTCVLTIR